MVKSGSEQLKTQCNIVLELFSKHYHNQITFNGVVKDIYIKFIDLRSKLQNNESIEDVSLIGCVRMFVDDTTDYNSPIIKEMEKAEKFLRKLQ